MMNSLMILDKCLLDENGKGVTDFLNGIDPATSNEKMQLFAEFFELPVVEVSGILFVHLSKASRILGYSNESGLRNLLTAYQIQTPKIGWFVAEVRTRIRKTFGLKEKDSQATLLGWGGVLVAGMAGTSDGARKIKLYLYTHELVTSEGLDQSADRAFRLREDALMLNLFVRYDTVKNETMRSMIGAIIERRTGKRLPTSAQTDLPFSLRN